MIGQTMSAVLERWKEVDAEAAAAEILPCCGSRAWARAVAGRRPIEREAELLATSDAVWCGLDERDWDEAFGTHPRIGERHATIAATGRSLMWSEREQSAVTTSGEDIAQELSDGNRAYEARFGRTFLVFANGRGGPEILSMLKARLGNDAATELREAVEQQRLITRLRLQRWMGAA